jgi:UDP-N-acetylglucosamine diphosphorylase/glucosamine-1-phosphate N-acetyltransferase
VADFFVFTFLISNVHYVSDQNQRPLAVVVMAAGQGKRMQDPTKAKVLYPLAGTPLLGHVLNLCKKIGAERTVVIIGYGREQVAEYLASDFPGVQTAVQSEQLGTGHAVKQTEHALRDFEGDILVLSGDVPLLTEATIRDLIATHQSSHALATVLAVTMPDPTGYGRIVRNEGGNLEKIVEHKDADDAIRAIREINSGIYLFDARTLFSVLPRVDRKNAQGEYYLTDVFALIISEHGPASVAVAVTNDPVEVSGVNTKDQLNELEEQYRVRAA